MSLNTEVTELSNKINILLNLGFVIINVLTFHLENTFPPIEDSDLHLKFF